MQRHLERKMAYLSGFSSLSDSSYNSFGSNDHGGTEPLRINSSVFLNNNIAFGSRLEMLQQIANRVQRECVNGEDKLALARQALQSDTKRLESGIQFLNEAEIASYLLECENILRQQVVDIQVLLDGKFPFADHLLQKVSKLRDDLLELRADCSSVYSKGRALTAEQTKLMISGITQSLNFSPINTSLTPSLTPALTPGGFISPGSTFTSSLTSSLTPSLTPALTPSLQPASIESYMGSRGGGMDSGGLMHLKHIQIRKPLVKSSLADSNMTEEEVNMKYVQDLLKWVEEMQLLLDRSEWGSDLPSVEMHLENHKGVHRAIEDFQMSVTEARMSEIQMTMPLKLSYSDKLSELEKQYTKLMICSRDRQSHLESLQDYVSQATHELIWLNEKEEEEVAFDWSDRHSHISKKRDYHADLMRELDEKEGAIKSVQEKADRLLLKNHPARLTIEAYRAAMQTQWNWILQLCSCVEQHLKENAVYFEFFSDAKESADYLKSMQDSIQRKYSCDRMSSLHRLEDLIQESMDEKEQLLSYRNTVAGLMGRAKNIVQLRPRNPDNALRSSIHVKAICDYRQIEINIYKDDECVLASNSHRAKWKVINPAGNEAMVPSVCFTVPPPNKEAIDMAARTEQLYQNVLALWHRSHVNMKSVVSWHYLMGNIRTIRNWNVASIKTMLPGEHQQVLSNLESHFDEFLEDSRESEVFTMADCSQLERDVASCKDYYQELLRSAEREEHEESVYNNYISELRNFRMQLEAHEEHLIRKIRSPLERVDLEQSLRCITEHEGKTAELNKLKGELDLVKEKCDVFLRQAPGSSPTLSSELSVLVQSMHQVYSMSSIYMDKLKTVNLVLQHSQNAEALVKAYESKLYEVDAMNSDIKSIEHVISTLKKWRIEIDDTQDVFHDMEDELQKARVISDRMFKAHNERDFDLDWHKEKADQLSERWQNIHSQIDSRLRDLEGMSKSLKHYRESYNSLDEWVGEIEAAQLKIQESKPEDSKALAGMLNKQKNLVAEIEQKQSRIDECQKYSEQYASAIKDYELQLMTFRAMVDSQHKSPLKKRKMQSSSDAIQQEFMDLRTRYTALVTLMTQCVKFASETLRRTEHEENRKAFESAENTKKRESMEHLKASGEADLAKLRHQVEEQDALLNQKQAQLEQRELEIEKQKKTIGELNSEKSQLELEVSQYQTRLELAMKDKAACQQELQHTKLQTQQLEALLSSAQKKLEELSQEQKEAMDQKIQSSNVETKVTVEKLVIVTEENVQNKTEVHSLGHESVCLDSQCQVEGEPKSGVTTDQRIMNDVLEQKLEELVMVQKKAEIAEEKALSYKKMLDDSNNRMKKLQIDIDTEKAHMREKIEDLQSEIQNMRKTTIELQDEMRSLQRSKSSLEQSTFFQNTEIEGLKEQLKITHGELQRKSSIEQLNMSTINNLEEEVASRQLEIDQLKFRCSELTRTNVSLERETRTLQIQVESLGKEQTASEQKIKSLKRDIDSGKQQLQECKEENASVKKSKQVLENKCKNIEAECEKSELAASQLQKKIEELRERNVEMEQNVKNEKAKLDHAKMELEGKDQQLKIFKSQVESSKSQVRIIEEELDKRSQTSYNLQIKLQDYSEEVKKIAELEQKVTSLNIKISSSDQEIRSLNTELKSMLTEKNVANQKLQMQESEINDLKVTLTKKNLELQKESTERQKQLSKLKTLEEELSKHKQDLRRVTSSTDENTNIHREVHTLQNEKKAAEQRVETLNIKVSELSSSLKTAKDTLTKETKEREAKDFKIRQLESELQLNKMATKAPVASSDQFRSNVQLENTILKNEKEAALEKNISLETEVRMLKENLQHTKTEAEQKQRENCDLLYKLQQMEEQLGRCKKMLDELKSKFKLQKEAYEQQLVLVQTQLEEKILILQSANSNESQNSVSTELSDQVTQQSKQDVKQIKIAESEISQLKVENIKLNSSLSSLQGLCNKQSNDLSRFEQLLKDSEWKMTMKENEVRALQKQMEVYVEEVKSLQEKLLRLRVEVMETSHENKSDNKADWLKGDVNVMLKPSSVNEDASLNTEVTKLANKDVSQTLNMENKVSLKGQTEEVKSQSLPQDRSCNQARTIVQNNMQHLTQAINSPTSLTTHGYMSLCGPTGQQTIEERITKTRTYYIQEVHVPANSSKICTSTGKTNAPIAPEVAQRSSIHSLSQRRFLDEEVLRKLEMGTTTLEEVQALLPQCSSKPKAVAGIYVESSKKKLSFLEAAEKGFLAKTYALEFLEAQAASGSLTDLVTGQTHSVSEALERGIIDPGFKDKLMEAEKAVNGYVHKGKRLSVFQAMEERLLERYKGKKILEVQVATGGVINPETGDRVPACIAVMQGLLNKETLLSLCDPSSTLKGFHNPDTGQKSFYSEILRTCLYDIDGGVYLYPFGERHLTNTSLITPQRVAVVNSSCDMEMSAYEALKSKYIDRNTYLFLSQQESEWQERSTVDPSGNPIHTIIDAKSGRQLCLESALSQRFLESSELESYRNEKLSINEIADIIFSRMVVVEDVNSSIAGLFDINQKKRLSVLEGFQLGLTDRSTATRLLEAQACTGGICDPYSGEKVPLSEALKRGLLDKALHEQLQHFDQAFNGITHPKTAKTLSVFQALQENLFPEDAALRCMEFQFLTGGLINPETHDRVSLEEVVQSGHVDKVTAANLKDEKCHTKSLTCPKTKRRLTFKEALVKSVYDCHTGLRVLEATKILGLGPKSTFHYAWAYK